MKEELHIKLRTDWVGGYCSEYADDSFGKDTGSTTYSGYCTPG